MLFSNSNHDVGTNELRIGDKKVEQIGTHCKDRYFKFVGHVLDDRLNWEGHIEHITKKTCQCNLCHKFIQKLFTPKN